MFLRSYYSSLFIFFTCLSSFLFFFFFFNDTATTEIYTLSLHDALPIWSAPSLFPCIATASISGMVSRWREDRKSTRLNSSHGYISYAVFCLKKKKQHNRTRQVTRQSDLASSRRHTISRSQLRGTVSVRC